MLGCFSSLIILPTTHLTYCACRRDCESGAVLSYRYSVNAVGCTKYLSSLCGGGSHSQIEGVVVCDDVSNG